MSAKLPFKTSPKPFELVAVGDEKIGVLELPRMDDLSPNERIYLREQMADYPDLRSTAAKMARAIATKSGRKINEIYDALVGGKEETLDDYLEDFIEFQGLIEKVSQQRRVALATAIIRYRLMPEWNLGNTKDANLIPPALVAAVADFGRKEEMGWQEDATRTAPIEGEEPRGNEATAVGTVGKPQVEVPEPVVPSPDPKVPTVQTPTPETTPQLVTA